MDVHRILSRLGSPAARRDFAIEWIVAPALAYALISLWQYRSSRAPKDSIFRAPQRRLLAVKAHKSLSYPPDALPGARDVNSPYGNIRVYEWGPETGKKVLFVHGISTPCVAFAKLAKKLVDEQGCRVMLFDLFGRGYSDAPDPEKYPQDLNLWAAQMFCVLASSSLSWTGKEKFALVGYSLGGGIGASFTSYFPELVRSLILIAPAGLLRDSRIHWTSKCIYGNLLPASVIDWLVSRRLTSTLPAPQLPEGGEQAAATSPGEIAASEAPHPALTPNSDASLFSDRPNVSAASVVNWQAECHPGFLASFISSIQHSPTRNQQERWRLVAKQREHLEERKVLIILGKTDAVILPEETAEDAKNALGNENVRIEMLDGGHDVTIVNAEGCARIIEEFWQ